MGQDSCFSGVNSAPRLSLEDNTTRLRPICTIETSSVENKDFKCVEIKANQFRLIGEYGVLTINCSAEYILNFVYDGFRNLKPTEAVKISYWKNISIDFSQDGAYQNHSIKLYGITIRVTSNENLYEDYVQNGTKTVNTRPILNPIVYSRTGRFNIQEMYTDEFDSVTSFYFFFEEPLMAGKESLMWNQYTEYSVISRQNSHLIIPCRPSHSDGWTKLNLLVQKNPTDEFQPVDPDTFDFDPTLGFLLNMDSDLGVNSSFKEIQFKCEISFNSKNLTWMATSKRTTSRANFGLNQLNMKRDPTSIKLFIENIQNKTTQFSTLRCLLNEVPSSGSQFLSWGQPLTSFTQFNLSREFVLPIFSHLSYSVQSGIQPYANSFSFNVTRENTYGAVFCTNGSGYQYNEFATGVNGQLFQFKAGINWLPMNPQAPSSTYLKIRLDEPAMSPLMYTRDPFLFVCRHAPHCVTRPVLWFTKNTQGKITLVYKDFWYKDDFPKLLINLTTDIAQVSCSMSFYDSHHWMTSAIDLNLADGNEPKLKNTMLNFKFKLGSQSQVIKCQASGKPTPTVWWQRNDEILNDTIGQGSAIYEIDTVTEQDYGEFCDLGNLLGFLQKNRYEFLDMQNYSNVAAQNDLNVNLLLKLAWEIAQGLLYLASKKVIHGDLACRNILLTKDKQVKITDFGLSRQLYAYSMYVKQSQEPLPWRWLAIESLADLTFTIESDIWSYGVLLWEIFSLGEVPYPGLAWTPEFVDSLRGGTRMGCPKMMKPDLFSSLVLPSWIMEPSRRPKFDQIISIIDHHRNDMSTNAYENPSLDFGSL